jgi:hypothetical protein
MFGGIRGTTELPEEAGKRILEIATAIKRRDFRSPVACREIAGWIFPTMLAAQKGEQLRSLALTPPKKEAGTESLPPLFARFPFGFTRTACMKSEWQTLHSLRA